MKYSAPRLSIVLFVHGPTWPTGILGRTRQMVLRAGLMESLAAGLSYARHGDDGTSEGCSASPMMSCRLSVVLKSC